MNERELLVDCLRRLNGVGVTYYLTFHQLDGLHLLEHHAHHARFVFCSPTAGARSTTNYSGVQQRFSLMKLQCAQPINRRISSMPLTRARN